MSQSTETLCVNHRLFIAEWFRNGRNGTQAYRKIYNPEASEEVASVSASQILALPKVKEAVERRLKQMADAAEVNSEWSLSNLKYIAERCQQAEPVMEFDREEKCMVKTGEYKFDSAGANSAIDKINKMLGCYAAEKSEQAITTNITITNYADLKDLDS